MVKSRTVRHQLLLATIPSTTVHKTHTFHSIMSTSRAPKPWQKTTNTQKSTFKKLHCISELMIDERAWRLLDFYVLPQLLRLIHNQMKRFRDEIMTTAPYQGISLNDLSK